MQVTITAKLQEDSRTAPGGAEGTMFFLRLGNKVYDRKGDQEKWFNYDIALYAKNGKQANFYQQSLIKGAIVTITGEGLMHSNPVKDSNYVTDKNGWAVIQNDFINARLDNVFAPPTTNDNQAPPASSNQYQRTKNGA